MQNLHILHNNIASSSTRFICRCHFSICNAFILFCIFIFNVQTKTKWLLRSFAFATKIYSFYGLALFECHPFCTAFSASIHFATSNFSLRFHFVDLFSVLFSFAVNRFSCNLFSLSIRWLLSFGKFYVCYLCDFGRVLYFLDFPCAHFLRRNLHVARSDNRCASI